MAGDQDVHAPHAGDDVHGQHNGAEHSELAENVRRLLLPLVHANVDLGEIVRVGSRQEPTREERLVTRTRHAERKRKASLRLAVAQVARHGKDVVLNITQIQPDLGAGRNFPLFVAALREPFDHVGLVAE